MRNEIKGTVELTDEPRLIVRVGDISWSLSGRRDDLVTAYRAMLKEPATVVEIVTGKLEGLPE